MLTAQKTILFIILAVVHCLEMRLYAQSAMPSFNNLPFAPGSRIDTFPPTGVIPGSSFPPGSRPPQLNIPPAKYTEYQSYCRSNDFDAESALSAEQKQKRLDILNKKISADAKNPVVAAALVKERLQNKDLKLAENDFLKYKDILKPEDKLIIEVSLDVLKKSTNSAAIKLEAFLKDNSKNLKVLSKLAEIKKLQGLYSEARQIYFELNQINKTADYSKELCELYSLDSLQRDAESACLSAATKYPNDPYPEVYLGIAMREKEKYAEAQAHFESSLKKKKTEFALTCLGELFALKKNIDKSISYLSQSIESNKNSYRAQLGLAITYFQDKKYDLALNHFKEVCRIKPGDTSEMRRAQKILADQKSTYWEKYYQETQKCAD